MKRDFTRAIQSSLYYFMHMWFVEDGDAGACGRVQQRFGGFARADRFTVAPPRSMTVSSNRSTSFGRLSATQRRAKTARQECSDQVLVPTQPLFEIRKR